MTAVLTSSIAPAQTGGLLVGLRQTAAFTKRSILGRLRQPASLAPSFVFPLFFAALSSSSFSRTTALPNFPADSFLAFSVAGAIVQGVLFGSTAAASDLAIDIEQGFWERMVASPVARTSIVLGRLASSFVFGMAQSAVFLTLFRLFGVHIKGGPLGVIGIVVGGGLLGLAISGLLSSFAIRSGSSEAVQGVFPLMFILLFLSSAFFPRQYMSGWYKSVADVNPMSHIVEGLRSFVIEPASAGAFARAWGIPFAIATATIGLALLALQRRLRAS
jgi:ABC-2 type transport system permease protein